MDEEAKAKTILARPTAGTVEGAPGPPAEKKALRRWLSAVGARGLGIGEGTEAGTGGLAPAAEGGVSGGDVGPSLASNFPPTSDRPTPRSPRLESGGQRGPLSGCTTATSGTTGPSFASRPPPSRSSLDPTRREPETPPTGKTTRGEWVRWKPWRDETEIQVGGTRRSWTRELPKRNFPAAQPGVEVAKGSSDRLRFLGISSTLLPPDGLAGSTTPGKGGGGSNRVDRVPEGKTKSLRRRPRPPVSSPRRRHPRSTRSSDVTPLDSVNRNPGHIPSRTITNLDDHHPPSS